MLGTPAALAARGSEAGAAAAQAQLASLTTVVDQLTAANARLQQDVEWLRRALTVSTPASFSVAQYNILAGYLGNNMEPWFLYGVDCPPERRELIFAKHREKDSAGVFVHKGWPNYVKGILTEEEIETVERTHRELFQWEDRRERILRTIEELDSDVISLVECDHFEERTGVPLTVGDHDPNSGFFKERMAEKGYDGVWAKRPRETSHDGSAVFWRRSCFTLEASQHIVLVDAERDGRRQIDRVCLAVLLRFAHRDQCAIFLSTHLARNPEEERQEWLRARQIGQVLKFLAHFAHEHCALDAPVVIAGDMNSANFVRVRGLAEAILVLRGDLAQDQVVHPMLFEARDVPTGATSVTDCRQVRIDALLYNRTRLQLKDVRQLPHLSHAIPSAEHPSDHLPIKASFCVRTGMNSRDFSAATYVKTLLGIDVQTPLNGNQLEDVFLYFDWYGKGHIDRETLLWSLCELDISLRVEEQYRLIALLTDPDSSRAPSPRQLPGEPMRAETPVSCSSPMGAGDAVLGVRTRTGDAGVAPAICRESFARAYVSALRKRLPDRGELRWAFSMMDSSRTGTLTLRELQVCFSAACPFDVSAEAIEAIFAKVDHNGDGKVTWDEFLNYSAATYGSFCNGALGKGPRASVAGEAGPAAAVVAVPSAAPVDSSRG
eukprot:TRINITY_DN35303_c0_g1_i1.p1 TRINITY_DN35303_c0_g1~~TRINITY_DN35303_c0_g1_i1.p1  ORF type:complete len:662 (+),score=192.93 TRINITY_DN35303_c0_g1_i1:83-2068(+)